MREKIIEKALQLFSEYGYDSTGINEIVGQCSVTKPTLYYYFDSKDNLLQAIVQEHGLALRTAVSKRSQRQSSFEEILAGAADSYLKYVSDNKLFMRLYLALVFTPHSNKAYDIVKNEAEAIQAIFEAFFHEETTFYLDKSFLAASFIGQLNFISTLILNKYLTYSEEVSRKILYLFLNGARRIGK